jgi:Beta-lactamase enzyme family
MALTDAQLGQIAALLFLLKTPAPTPLPKPTNTDDTSDPGNLAAKMQTIATDAEFNDLGIGAVDFTASVATPKVWLLNPDKSFRIASTGKLAILLAAVQLRDDVRKAKTAGFLTTPNLFDEAFTKVWARSKNAGVKIIGKGGHNPPRISTIFDLTKSPPDFRGADVPIDKQKMSDIGDAHLEWSGVPDLSFWELMNLTGAQSDDVAAAACVSEIGVGYMKAVQKAFGLYDPSHGMHMLIATGYDWVDSTQPVTRAAGAPNYRPLTDQESNSVLDTFWETEDDPKTPSKKSVEPGSAAALTAYMLALMQNKLIDATACDTIRTHLADETALNSSGPTTTTSLVMVGANTVSHVTKAHTKLGILDANAKQVAKGQVNIRAEFAYLEAGGKKFAIMGTGLVPKTVGGHRKSEVDRGVDLGKAIANAL